MTMPYPTDDHKPHLAHPLKRQGAQQPAASKPEKPSSLSRFDANVLANIQNATKEDLSDLAEYLKHNAQIFSARTTLLAAWQEKIDELGDSSDHGVAAFFAAHSAPARPRI